MADLESKIIENASSISVLMELVDRLEYNVDENISKVADLQNEDLHLKNQIDEMKDTIETMMEELRKLGGFKTPKEALTTFGNEKS